MLRGTVTLCILGLMPTISLAKPDQPNIVWIIIDDMSADFSCYGEKPIKTPHVDRLAREGTKFTKAFVTAPVCSPCRSALITGCYQTTIGSHHHRSGRGSIPIVLPEGVVPVPKLFQDAGYYTCNGGPLVARTKNLAKTDYNFEWDKSIYDSNDWAGRKPGQPFFMQVQLHGGKYRGQGPNPNFERHANRDLKTRVNPDDVTLPPYYPRDPVILKDWANYLDCCQLVDQEVGQVIERLERENLLGSTVVFFMTDHGISHARSKQFLYDAGLHVPFVVCGPGVEKGAVRNDLIEHIDMAATSLALAGIPIPKSMQARNVLANDYAPREAVFAARDRCDETIDHIRSVRTVRYKYIRNYLPKRPLLQPCHYKDSKAVLITLRRLHHEKKLNTLQDQLLFSDERPLEELYDLNADPWEVKNLAGDPQSQKALNEMRNRLATWEAESGDLGREPESWAKYDADMAVYMKEFGPKRTTIKEIFERNIAINKKWGNTAEQHP